MTEETAQNWLNTTYQDKNVSKIELWNKERGEPEKLTGELKIEGYTKVEEINFERWDKEKFKDEITKVTINNCPQVKKLKFNNNQITEITFQGTFLNLGWLDLPDNKLTKFDVSKFPNLTRLSVARNPNLTEIEGWENLTKIEFINLFDTPGLNNQKFSKWKEGINSALGLTPKDSPLPGDWENKLDDLKNRPTNDELKKAVKEAVDNKEAEYKDYINPNNPNDKSKLEKAAKDAGFGFTQADIDQAVQKERDNWKGFIDPKNLESEAKKAGWKYRQEDLDAAVNKEKDKYKDFIDPKDKNALEAAARKNGMVPQTDLDNANRKVKDYEDGLKDKLGLSDNNLSTWKGEIDKLKNRPTSDNSEKIKNILGIKPNDPLPSDWDTKLVPKTKLDEWEKVFGTGKSPADIKKDLESRPGTGGSGTGLSTEQQQKLNDYDKLEKQKKWLLRYIEKEKSKNQYAQILQEFNKV